MIFLEIKIENTWMFVVVDKGISTFKSFYTYFRGLVAQVIDINFNAVLNQRF